jgi:hypothetical protein
MEIYHRSAAGKVVWLEMTRDEAAEAIARAPWEWHTAPRGFAPWPADRVRGVPTAAPSLADTLPSRNKIWDRAT